MSNIVFRYGPKVSKIFDKQNFIALSDFRLLFFFKILLISNKLFEEIMLYSNFNETNKVLNGVKGEEERFLG